MTAFLALIFTFLAMSVAESKLSYHYGLTYDEADYYVLNGYTLQISNYGSKNMTGTTVEACVSACSADAECSGVVMNTDTDCTLYNVIVRVIRRNRCTHYIKKRVLPYARDSLSLLSQLVFGNLYYPDPHCPRGWTLNPTNDGCDQVYSDDIMSCCTCYDADAFPAELITCTSGVMTAVQPIFS